MLFKPVERFTIKMRNNNYLLFFIDSFQKYDYGSQGNLMHYGKKNPPLYNISKTTVPTYLYYGGNDAFIHQKVGKSKVFHKQFYMFFSLVEQVQQTCSKMQLLSPYSLNASLCGSVGKDFIYHACGHEFFSNFSHHL